MFYIVYRTDNKSHPAVTERGADQDVVGLTVLQSIFFFEKFISHHIDVFYIPRGKSIKEGME